MEPKLARVSPDGWICRRVFGTHSKKMFRVELAGIDSLLLTPLCRRCPHGRAGCCAAPPAVAWTDIGRIVRLGGRDFLLAEMLAKRLVPSPRGLSIQRIAANDDFPARCTYLSPTGCVLEPRRRSATCNYYVCDEAFVLAEEAGDPSVPSARIAHERIADLLGQCDIELSARVDARFPDKPSWDAAFLDWIAAQLDELLQGRRRELKRLGAK